MINKFHQCQQTNNHISPQLIKREKKYHYIWRCNWDPRSLLGIVKKNVAVLNRLIGLHQYASWKLDNWISNAIIKRQKMYAICPLNFLSEVLQQICSSIYLRFVYFRDAKNTVRTKFGEYTTKQIIWCSCGK
jgi:hypothetical protein